MALHHPSHDHLSGKKQGDSGIPHFNKTPIFRIFEKMKFWWSVGLWGPGQTGVLIGFQNTVLSVGRTDLRVPLRRGWRSVHSNPNSGNSTKFKEKNRRISMQHAVGEKNFPVMPQNSKSNALNKRTKTWRPWFKPSGNSLLEVDIDTSSKSLREANLRCIRIPVVPRQTAEQWFGPLRNKFKRAASNSRRVNYSQPSEPQSHNQTFGERPEDKQTVQFHLPHRGKRGPFNQRMARQHGVDSS